MTRQKSLGYVYALALLTGLFARNAHAEKTLFKDGEWEVYTDGRIGGFVSYIHGDGLPQSKYDATGANVIHDIAGGGLPGIADRQPIGTNGQVTQGTIDRWRVHTGFIGNTLGLGVRGKLDPQNTIIGYSQMWSYIEAQQQRKGSPNPPDVRQAYVQIIGPWGDVLVGRYRTLFSRGATDIDVMYAHRWGVGFSGGATDSYGPTQGQVGFGVLGSGFASGIQYGTPTVGGLKLTIGIFDPVALQGAWDRTKLPRPEAELTFEQPLGAIGKIVLFGNGAYQKLYKRDATDDSSTHAAGFGYGGRLELGAFHLGVAGHYGKGLGLNYALEPSDATLDYTAALRTFDGYYVQTQVVLGPVDLFTGAGITRVFLGPNDRLTDANGNIPHSVVKSQLGINAGAVFNIKPWLHLDLDYFRSNFSWWLGEKQNLDSYNAGLTFNW